PGRSDRLEDQLRLAESQRGKERNIGLHHSNVSNEGSVRREVVHHPKSVVLAGDAQVLAGDQSVCNDHFVVRIQPPPKIPASRLLHDCVAAQANADLRTLPALRRLIDYLNSSVIPGHLGGLLRGSTASFAVDGAPLTERDVRAINEQNSLDRRARDERALARE